MLSAQATAYVPQPLGRQTQSLSDNVGQGIQGVGSTFLYHQASASGRILCECLTGLSRRLIRMEMPLLFDPPSTEIHQTNTFMTPLLRSP